MGRSVIFQGTKLVIPDAYSYLDLTRLLTPVSGGVGIVALVGEADGGEPGITVIPGGASPSIVKDTFKSGPLADMTRIALRSGSDTVVQAGASTVLCAKTNNSTISTLKAGGLNPGAAQRTIITCVADSSDSLHQTYFPYDTPTDSMLFWFNTGGGVAPVVPGRTAYEVVIATDDTAPTVAAALQAAMDAVAGVTATVSTADVTASNDDLGAATETVDGGVPTGFTFVTDVLGVDVDNDASIVLNTAQYGAFTANYTAEIATVSGAKFLTVRDENGVPETSIGVGSKSYLNLQYTGDASTAQMTLSWVAGALKLAVTLAGDQTDGSADIDLDVTGLKLVTIANQISALTGYTATVEAADEQFDAVDLDLVLSAEDVKTAIYGFVASIKELQDWAETQSQLLSSIDRGTENEGDEVPGTLATSVFSGGTRGTTSNADVQAILNELLNFRTNIVVPLFSSDSQDGSTITIEAINSQVKDHVQSRSSILGRSEAQSFVSIAGDKDAFIAECARMGSRYVAVTSQKITDLDIDGNLVEFPEYGFAVVCAQTQAGSAIGTPLTNKVLPISGINQNVSWNPVEDGAELVEKGALIASADENNQLRIVAGYTSWLGDGNNANIYIETVESFAIFSFNHRQFMKQKFVGVSAFSEQDVLDAIQESLDVERDVTRSIKGYDFSQVNLISTTGGRLEYEVPVIPWEGINFVLPIVVGIREG